MQIGCTLKTIRFHKIRYHLLCWYLGSARIAGKQGYLPSGLHGCTCLECRMGREWCTRSAHRQIHWRYILDSSLIALVCFEIFVVFSYDGKHAYLVSATWFRLRAETSINTLRNTSGCKQRFNTCHLVKNLVPHLSRFVGCLVAESQLRDIDNLLSVEG